MTLRLILMRHAKSDWGGIDQPDHDRDLNARGVRSAAAMGDWLRGKGYLPDHILSSDAQRTRATCAGLALPPDPQFLRALYLASSEDMLATLQHVTEAKTVLMLGHNPGIADLASRLLTQFPDDPEFTRYPSCATSVITFDCDTWQGAHLETGHLLDFMVPKRLL